MNEFSLEKALAGALLITRDGRPVTNFSPVPERSRPFNTAYPFEATVSGKRHVYTARGTYWIEKADEMDLFLVHATEAPCVA